MRKTILYIAVLLACGALHAQNTTDTDTFLTAVAEYSEGFYKQALPRLMMLHAKNPTDDAVSYYLGLCEYSIKDYETAESHLTEAAQADSTNDWYLNALATLYEAKGDNLKSAEITEKLVKRNPGLYSNPQTLTLIGDAKMNARQDSLALSYYNQALDIDPDYAPAELSRCEVLRMQRNYAAYFAGLSHFISNEDVRGDIKSDYLTQLMDRVDSRFYWVWGDQINNLVDKCRDMHPEDITIQMLKLRMLYIKKDYEGVLSQCGIIEKLAKEQGDNENYVEALTIEGDLYHQLGDMKKCYAAYDAVLSVKPDQTSALNNYAYFLCQEGKSLKKALKMSKKAVDLEPDNATYLDTYGWILYLLNKPKEAKPYFKHAMIYGGKDSAVVLEHYSKVLEALGEDELATYYRNLSEQKK